MHPFLKSPVHLVLMGFLWSPILLCTVMLQTGLSDLTFLEALLLVGPPMGVEFFVCLSLWYPCKTITPERHNFAQMILRHSVSAVVMISVWILAAGLYSEALDIVAKTDVWRTRFNEAFPLLMGMGFFLYFLFCLIYYLLITIEKSRKMEQVALESRLDASRAELKSLRTSIHPHFLFNSMAALSTLTRTSPEQAQQMCIQLSDFMRYSLNYGQKEWAQVQDEIEHVENYLGIEKIRLGKRLKLDFQVEPEALEENLPPLTLLPLVENAVKHAFQQSLEVRTLFLRIQKIPDWLLIVVRNSYDRRSQAAHSGGHGLKGLKKRLANVYGDRASMVVDKENEVFMVTLRIPVDMEGKGG